MPDLQISQRQMEVVFSAVEEGLNTLKIGQEIVPFVLFLTKEGLVLHRFADPKIADAIARAHTAIALADEDVLGYALVYDGQIEIAGKNTDALMIETGERDKRQGWRFVQRYQAQTSTNPMVPIGELAYIGNTENYLA